MHRLLNSSKEVLKNILPLSVNMHLKTGLIVPQ